ncbi:MAG TPA: hypothetical protein DCE75_01895 [Acidimicrobiaceae bacterium]|nr:hypothetical protein [Acidimicrobiaceae bacterium]
MTRVDVIVAALNEQQHLAACLRSIQRQRKVDLGLIVVDDGSTDQTTVIARAAAAADDRVHVIRHESPRGLAIARNAGLAAATAPWVTFVDGDDFLLPGALRSRLEQLADAPSDTVGAYGDWISVPERMPLLPVRRRAARRPDVWMVPAGKGVPFIASAPVIAREIVEELGGFDPRWKTGEDAEFWRWWLRLQARTVYTPHLCVAYRRRTNSMRRRDPGGHYRANRDAFAALDLPLPNDAPAGVLTATDATYRTAAAHQSRGLWGGALGLAEGQDDEVDRLLAELDPVALRLGDPSVLAAQASATARRRVRGTKRNRDLLARLDATAPSLRERVSAAAAPRASRAELRDAAAWLRGCRELPGEG